MFSVFYIKLQLIMRVVLRENSINSQCRVFDLFKTLVKPPLFRSVLGYFRV